METNPAEKEIRKVRIDQDLQDTPLSQLGLEQ
jgi:hypothetical protein